MYNFLNLPYKIIGAENDELQMLYAADGALLQRKYIRNNIVQNKVDYISDKEYHNDALEYIHHADGRVIKNGTTFQYEYNIKDHLGNVRATFCDVNGNGLISNSVTERRSRLDYYSFGMEHYRGAFEYTAQKNNYKYGGKEKVEEMSLGLYDFHTRQMDPAIGRFLSIDPLSDAATGWTPYRYGFNNPLTYSNPTGMYESSNAQYNEIAEAQKKKSGQGVSGYVTNNKNSVTLVVFGQKTLNEQTSKGFKAAYDSAKKNKNVDVFIATDLKQLNEKLDISGKVYNNIFFADHGSYPQDGIGDGNDAAQLVGNFPNGIESTNQYSKLSDNLTKNGNIIFGGCFTGSCKYGGDNFLEKVANASNRNVYGNQGESYYGGRIFDHPLGGAYDGHQPDYLDVSNNGAGKWLKATPRLGSEMLNNLILQSNGQIGFTNFLNGNKIRGRRK